MNLVPYGIAAYYNYTSYDLSPSLFIAAIIKDLTSGTPVVISGPNPIPLQHTNLGSYIGSFVPAAEKIYEINIMVYTDNTYTTPNVAYTPATELYTTQYAPMAQSFWLTDITTAIFNPAVSAANFLRSLSLGNVATSVWGALRSSFTGAGTFGEALQGIITPSRAAALDNLDIPISSVGASSENFEFVVGIVEELEEVVGIVE